MGTLPERVAAGSRLPSRRLVLVSTAPSVEDAFVGQLAERNHPGETESVLSSAGKTCSCGHERRAHQHYRRGTDCALCDCDRFHRPFLSLLKPRGR
jgi:hypothetical protein